MKKIVFIVLAPLLIVQGLWARKKTLRLPEPSGARAGVAGSGEILRLLILGDSAAAGVGVDTQEKALSGQVAVRLARKYHLHWELDAETGRTTQDTLTVLKRKEENAYDTVLISLGVNDVTSRVNAENWIRQCDELVEVLKSRFLVQRIIWSDLPSMEKFTALPQPLRWVVGQRKDYLRNALVKWIKTQENVDLLEFPDIFSDSDENITDWIAVDGYHPGEKVYALWAQSLFNYI